MLHSSFTPELLRCLEIFVVPLPSVSVHRHYGMIKNCPIPPDDLNFRLFLLLLVVVRVVSYGNRIAGVVHPEFLEVTG